jgi:hypothetical protein
MQQPLLVLFLDALLHANDIEAAQGLLTAVGAVDSPSWNQVLVQATEVRQHDGVKRVLAKMGDLGIAPNAAAAEGLIELYSSEGCDEDAVAIADAVLSSKDKDTELTTTLTNAVLSLFLRLNDHKRFRDTLNSVGQRQVTMDETTYSLWVRITLQASSSTSSSRAAASQALRIIDAMYDPQHCILL